MGKNDIDIYLQMEPNPPPDQSWNKWSAILRISDHPHSDAGGATPLEAMTNLALYLAEEYIEE